MILTRVRHWGYKPMKSNEILFVHSGTVIEDDSLTLGQLCRACGTHADWIISLVEESIIEPSGEEMRHVALFRRKSGASPFRVGGCNETCGINLAGIALALDLMEELESLRAQIKTGNT